MLVWDLGNISEATQKSRTTIHCSLTTATTDRSKSKMKKSARVLALFSDCSLPMASNHDELARQTMDIAHFTSYAYFTRRVAYHSSAFGVAINSNSSLQKSDETDAKYFCQFSAMHVACSSERASFPQVLPSVLDLCVPWQGKTTRVPSRPARLQACSMASQ